MMVATGEDHLRFVGPTHGFFGLGLAFYFVSQGARKLLWPLLVGFVRLLVAVGSGWLALKATGSLTLVLVMLGAALVLYGAIVGSRSGQGWWFRKGAADCPYCPPGPDPDCAPGSDCRG